MDQVKLETKWPPDRKSTVIGASEFGIYKEPADGKLLRHTDRATGCLLVLSLIAAAVVVVYFTFFDYTTQTTQVPLVGPVVSYAKYVKDKQATIGPGNRSADGLLAAVLGMKNAAENYTSTMRAHATHDDAVMAERVDGGNGRHMRLYPAVHRPPPVYLPTSSESSGRRNSDVDKHYGGAFGYSTDGLYGFGRRSDFPQLSAYRAPFPPKSVLAVMKYVTGSSPPSPYRTVDVADHMIAEESKTRYVPAVRPAEEVNRFLPDANAPPTSVGSMRFRNKFGPPVYVQPPMVAFPDDFMKPPNPGARFSMNFENDVLPDGVLHAGSSNVPLHTDAVFHSSSEHSYPVPDQPSPKKVKTKRKKSKKPISVMLDIYPISDHEHENGQADDEEEDHSEMFTSLKNNLQQSDRDNLLFRLNLFPKYNDGGRRISKNVQYENEDNQKPTIHLTTQTPLQVEENDGHSGDEESFEDKYTLESKNMANVSKIL